ncbi:Tse2 family ADP-ribosyltransferase toxin [Streptomyces mirabilis]|uniref:Tse2 family ADP-ribosyltransferase toxin n=1 Tax=Streptomyces mirabilis TaxID=68239 RepID=UPI00369D425B
MKWVQGMAEGISTYDIRLDTDTRWWTLPAGSDVPDGLTLYDDRANLANHYLWKPTTDMTLADYETALRQVAPWTRRPTLEELEGRIFTPVRAAALVGHGEASEEEQPMGWESKTHRYVLAAVDAQVRELRERLARYPEDSDTEEQAAAANDLLLYEAISAEISRRGPAPLTLPDPAPTHHGHR